MRKTLIPLVVVLIFLFIGLPQVFFVVDETELAIVTRFGAFQRDHQSPGLKIKTPIVDNVTKFDKRLLRIDAPPTSLLTKDKKNLVIDAYARYKIINPLLFFQSISASILFLTCDIEPFATSNILKTSSFLLAEIFLSLPVSNHFSKFSYPYFV